MDFETLFGKTPATLDEIKTRVGYARLQAVEPRALWEASDIVADIQAAYDLATAA
jgi:hypothetical protein